ncbi:MAG: NADAR family protein [Candidatus Saccharibacteria bacterium]|nr:NADAR family protein [Candidatus Saccharibacteria bacterium]
MTGEMPASDNPLYSEVSDWKPGGWRERPEIIQNETMIKGFFGDYRWLSSFGQAHLELDGAQYPNVEVAYQAAKWRPEDRQVFQGMTGEQAITYNRQHVPDRFTADEWDRVKLSVMMQLVGQKFCPVNNPENAGRLLATGDRYLEETNWWGDTFWGKNLRGEGENNLGEILMSVRRTLREASSEHCLCSEGLGILET